jgi:RNA polymerase sporulation-specific sigma factor
VNQGRGKAARAVSGVGTGSVSESATAYLKKVTKDSSISALVDEARYDVSTDEELIAWNREGDGRAGEILLARYRNFARMKARSYFLVGAERDDILQESMIGLYKAIRDFQADKQASFRAFADVCITRQLITAIRSARCQKHGPLNTYVSLNKPLASDDDTERVLMDVLSGPGILDPADVVIATEELADIKAAFDQLLSGFEIEVLHLYADGKSYHEIAELLDREVKSIDNALQRIKRKIELYLRSRNTEGHAVVRPAKVAHVTAAAV